MNAHDMVMRCYRHQHPEAYGREAVPYGWFWETRGGAEVVPANGECLPDPPSLAVEDFEGP